MTNQFLILGSRVGIAQGAPRCPAGCFLSGDVPKCSHSLPLYHQRLDSYPDFAYQSGLRDVRFLVPCPMSGRMCAVALAHATMAIEFGLANCVAIVYATNQRSAGMRYGAGIGEGGGFEGFLCSRAK